MLQSIRTSLIMDADKQNTGAKPRETIILKEPVIVMTGPPQPADTYDWGFYQFPDMWQGCNGELYVAVNVGADSRAGRHEPTIFLVSRDHAETWSAIPYSHIDMTPDIVGLPDGTQIMFGDTRRLPAFTILSEEETRKKTSAKELGLVPVSGPVLNGYKANEYMIYRYTDIPERLRKFRVRVRSAPKKPWEEYQGIIHMPDMLLAALSRAGWWDDNHKFKWEEQHHTIRMPVPTDNITVLPDNTLLWTHASQHPDVTDKCYYRVACLASTDYGRTWHLRGFIADDTDLTTYGYGSEEQSLARMPDGDLMCVMRTKMSNNASDPHYLAAARSKDNGFTWTKPEPLTEFSVTPHLFTQDNKTVVLVYGRPGVHARVSSDSGRTWSRSVSLIGPSEEDLLAKPLEEWWKLRHVYSCSNTTVVVTGPDRFLVAYSDFQHTGKDGRPCKAIKVREVMVTVETLKKRKP